uniref:Transcriptional regulator n=1 Tax=Heterorhabditis bacteriophora TaxID=37862 RepID=A0A1I7WRT8_HETBA
MAEVYVSGQIVSADLFEDNRLACMWSLQIGNIFT